MEEMFSPDGLQRATVEAAGVTNEFVIPAYLGAAEEPAAGLVAAGSVTSRARGAHWQKLKKKKKKKRSVSDRSDAGSRSDAESSVASTFSKHTSGASTRVSMSESERDALIAVGVAQHTAGLEAKLEATALEAKMAAEAAAVREAEMEERFLAMFAANGVGASVGPDVDVTVNPTHEAVDAVGVSAPVGVSAVEAAMDCGVVPEGWTELDAVGAAVGVGVGAVSSVGGGPSTVPITFGSFPPVGAGGETAGAAASVEPTAWVAEIGRAHV